MNSASLCSLAGRYDNPIPPQFLAPIDFLKIPALCGVYQRHTSTEAEFLDDIQTKILRVFLLAIHSHLYSFALR
jgi:hypothetical protein